MKKIYLSLFLLLSALTLSAVPARPGAIKATQPDGTTITIFRHGDEFGHWTTDAQGRLVRKDADGWWRPVSGSVQAVRRQAAARRARANRARSRRAAEQHIALGEKHFLVVLVQFYDTKFTVSNPKTAFSNLLNQQGYAENGGKGSARDFYYDNSHGKFTPVFDVYGPVTLENDLAHYGGNVDGIEGNDKAPEEAVKEACELLDGEVDFSKFDNDGDGDVDLVFMYYAGYGEADSDDEDAIWPHQWELTSADIALKLDGKTIDHYACTNELEGYGTYEGKMCGIGTACHEFGHAMGLPDFYDTDYDTNGEAAALFDFSTMCGGAYNGDGRVPPYFNIEERILLGWIDDSAYEAFPKSGNYTLGTVDDNKAYRIPTDQDGEYFVLECRGSNGWDAALPAHGLIAYHVDKSSRTVKIDGESVKASELWSDWEIYNSINENGNHPCFYVVPAVDQDNLLFGYEYLEEYGGNYFDPDGEGLALQIPFPGSEKVTSYTPVSWNEVPSDISLSGIAYADNTASFTVSMPSAGLSYYTIQNPGKGRYTAGTAFVLQLNEVEDRPYSDVKWLFDNTEVAGPTVTLPSGSHTLEAVISLQDGKTQTVTLELQVR